ncbi:MAG: hypothetical protein ACFFCS_13915 [Candidatus Hodarchaeota archaeon]
MKLKNKKLGLFALLGFLLFLSFFKGVSGTHSNYYYDTAQRVTNGTYIATID